MFSKLRGLIVTIPCRPVVLATAAAGHDEAELNTVSVAMTALVPVRVVFGSEKHPFVSAGLLETVHAIVPVYPPCGVTVTVEAPELPADTVTLVAANLNDLATTLSVNEPVEGA